jgi:HemY protein
MRFWVVVVLLVLLAGAWLGTLMHVDPGYALLAWGNTSVEMSLWLLLAAVVLLFVAAVLSLRLLVAFNLPFQVLGRWQESSRLKRMQMQTRHGLLALADGQNLRAEKKFAELAPVTTQPIVVLPALATALGRQGKLDEAKQVLQRLVTEFPGSQQLVHLKLAEVCLYQGEDQSALESLQRLHQLNPQHAEANQLLLDVLQRVEQWPELIELLSAVGKYKQLTPEQLSRQQQLAYGRAFAQTQKNAANAADNGLDNLQALWQKAPPAVTQHGASILAYAQAMGRIEASPAVKTAAFIEQHLAQQWQDELVLEYAHLPLMDIEQRLSTAEAWQTKAQDSAALKLTLGRLCRRLELWGKAQDYLQASLNLQASKHAHAEMARLQHDLGHMDAAIEHYRLASVF